MIATESIPAGLWKVAPKPGRSSRWRPDLPASGFAIRVHQFAKRRHLLYLVGNVHILWEYHRWLEPLDRAVLNQLQYALSDRDRAVHRKLRRGALCCQPYRHFCGNGHDYGY
jgi:hypothetical protein